MNKIPYPSLFSKQRSPLNNARTQSLHPMVARIHLISVSSDENHRVQRLVGDCVYNNIGIDEALDLGFDDVDHVMADRVRQGKQFVPAYLLPTIELRPQSTDPDDFVPFDLASYLAAGGKPMPQLWIQDPNGPGPTF